MKKRIAICIIIICILSGCNKDIKITTGLSKNEIFKISGEPEELAEIMLVLMNEKNKYETHLGADIWTRAFEDTNLEAEIKDKVKNQMIELCAISLMAENEDIRLNDSEKDTLEQAAAQYFGSLSDIEKELLDVTEEDVFHLYQKMYLTDKYFDSVTKEDREISDEEAKVIEVMYIYFQTGNRDIYGNVTRYDEERITQIREKAQSVLDRVNQGEDFQSLAASESDDTEYKSVFGRGVMEENFETAAFGLTDGQISNLVETEDGYYIIKCIHDYLEMETAENKKNLEDKYKADKFKEIYEPFLEKQTLEFNNKVWQEISIQEYSECVSTDLYDVYNACFQH
ncbi:MAG: peptidylprolyl isomerase [Lachnospiraceae bacterium]|jgi:Parvulin-like peptidyl-prolyl isomerase|nr:hypothetical protein [Lachnospiraceae bacterium]MCI8824863.1 hypothetical protein [Lachnospiraceae bacterium]MCI9371440.1 hypothetical protein [Lachnospiraceae bacterium]MDE7309013.1 peptidylprolyl isomerase [Lachnospiraceae bacterium]